MRSIERSHASWSSRRILSAADLAESSWRARYTHPMPPIPTSRSMRYAEIKCPACKGPDGTSQSGADGISTCVLTLVEPPGAHHVPARLAATSVWALVLHTVPFAAESTGSWITAPLARFVHPRPP